MGKFFDLNSPLMRFLSRLADLMILNMIFLATCLPVVTIGAAWTALYYVAMKMVRDEEGGIIKNYFHAFRLNFKQATIIWLFALLAIGIFAGDVVIYRTIPDQIPKALMIAVLVLAYLVLGTIIYVFPLLSRYHNTIKGTIKNAFLVSVVNVPYTIIFVL